MDNVQGSTSGSAFPKSPLGFWRETKQNGLFSNWYPCSFTFRDKVFPTAEHWMMWQKAQVMGDQDCAVLILSAETPSDAKKLGAKVKPYSDVLWNQVREQLVYVGIREKFMQNPELAEDLLATGSSVLAEASPYDHVWGVGLSADDPAFSNPTKWKGSNLLGRVLMRVRADLSVAKHTGAMLAELARCEDDMVDGLCEAQIGSLSLVELSCVPAARAAVLCYARIAQHHSGDTYATLDDFLSQVGQSAIAEINASYRTGANGSIVSVGWYELIAQLAFMHAVGLT